MLCGACTGEGLGYLASAVRRASIDPVYFQAARTTSPPGHAEHDAQRLSGRERRDTLQDPKSVVADVVLAHLFLKQIFRDDSQLKTFAQ